MNCPADTPICFFWFKSRPRRFSTSTFSRGASEKLLDSYEQERAPVGKKLLESTERGLKIATLSNPLLEKIRDAVAPMLSKSHTLQHAVTAFISEIAIQYRSSHIVVDHGGDGYIGLRTPLKRLGELNEYAMQDGLR